MIDLKKIDSDKLIKKLALYISLMILTLVFLIIVAVSLAREQTQEKKQAVYNKQVSSSMEHVISHFIKDYTYRAKRMVETTSLAELIKKRDREGVFKMLNPKYQIMQEETPYFSVMHIHLADGSSFLRLHAPQKYGDDIASKRVMLRDVHKNHKLITGYETGVHATVYRVITPIFDKDGLYVGALDIGLNPNFIIEAIHEINGFYGAIFIKNEELKLYSSEMTMEVAGYRLQTKLNEKLTKICAKFQIGHNFEDKSKLVVEDKVYLVHVITLKNFEGEESVKLVFFQNITQENPFFSPTLIFVYFGIIIVLLLFIYLIYKRIKGHQEQLSSVYKEYIEVLRSNEKEIVNSQKYHKSLFDSIPEILIATDGENIKDANTQMLRFFGFKTLEEFSKEHECICDFFLEEDGYLHRDMGSETWLEYTINRPEELHKVGMLHDEVVHHFLIKLEELSYDESSRYLVSFVDISEVEELNDRLELAVTGTNDGLWDWNIKENRVYFSPRWKEMLGYKDDELENVFDTWQSRVHPDDLALAIEKIAISHNNSEVEYNITHRLRHKDGSWVWVLDRGQTLFDESGQAVRMVGFHTDITKQKKLEDDLMASKERFRQFMEHMPANILIKDREHRISYANRRAQEFFSEKNLIGKTSKDLLPPELIKKVDSFDNAAREKGVDEELIETLDAQGKKRVFRNLAFMMEEASEDEIGIVSLDITKEYMAQKEVEKETQKVKDQEEMMIAQSRHAAMGEMISMIAHQWRQPISVIAMDANNVLVDIELDSVDNDSLKSDVGDIIEQTQHLSKTIDDFRNFFKPNKDKESVFVEDVFMEAFRVIEKSLVNNDIESQSHFDSQTKINIFSRELLQVFINILKNAKEALEEKRTKERKIVSTISETQSDIVVEICDNGGGMSEAVKEKIFDPYFSTKSEKNGTGLGLYMSKIIVDKHLFGTISVETRDGGSCFVITLPKEERENG